MLKTLSISQRGKNAPASPVRKLVPFADLAKQKGIKVYHVNIGDPDFEAPQEIQQSLLHLAKTEKRIPYANSKGLNSTVEAWISYYKHLGISLSADDVLVTTGGSEALTLTSATLFDPGDEYIVFEPYYANYSSFGNLVSATPVPVVLDKNNGYHLPSDAEIVKRISPKTKALFFTNPNNPTGTVFEKEEILRLIRIARKYSLFLVSDEAYHGISFDGAECFSVLHLATQAELENIIVIDSVSKKLNVCGARVGAVISKNKEFMEAVFRFAQGRLSVPYIEQKMVEDLLRDPIAYVKEITAQYKKRRDAFLETLDLALGVTIHKPEGAFYTMVPLPVDDIEKFAKWLLTDFSHNNETVMIAPGAGFYATPGKGSKEARVAYVLNEKDLKRAAELLALGVKEYNQESRH
jgi:aspartate aminotransferase